MSQDPNLNRPDVRLLTEAELDEAAGAEEPTMRRALAPLFSFDALIVGFSGCMLLAGAAIIAVWMKGCGLIQ